MLTVNKSKSEIINRFHTALTKYNAAWNIAIIYLLLQKEQEQKSKFVQLLDSFREEVTPEEMLTDICNFYQENLKGTILGFYVRKAMRELLDIKIERKNPFLETREEAIAAAYKKLDAVLKEVEIYKESESKDDDYIELDVMLPKPKL